MVTTLYSQTGAGDNSIIPLRPDKSILFGQDILIKDSASQMQRQVANMFSL